MAELKRLLVGAKVDKDSDERFVKSGEFRDAVNIEIISSEGSDAGVARNKKSNTLQSTKTYNASTGKRTYWEEGTGTTFPFDYDYSTAETVGIYKHSPTNTIYSLVTSSTGDFIVEYNDDTKVISPILVDTTGDILKFTAGKRITGISFLEGTLGWVQDGVEPMAIVIADFKSGSTDFVTHTEYEGRDFIKSDVTLIKLSPLTAPTMSLQESLRDGILNTTTRNNFTLASLNDGSLSTPGEPGQAVLFSIPAGSAFIKGDKIKLSTLAPATDDLLTTHEMNIVCTSSLTGGSLISGTIISSSFQIEDNQVTWEVDLIEGKPLFELLFPRFSYRWKYKNNQYSTFAPFTKVGFLAGEYLYNSQKGFNTGMTNNVRKISLGAFSDFPPDVEEVDILYKKSNSSAVYVVDTIKADVTTYDVTSELIYKLVNSTQLLRPWDNVPRSAKALEVVANRLVIGNYKKNYSVDSSIKFSGAIVDSTAVGEINIPEESVKSLRTYQAGVLFKDDMGRETPIFSDKSGVIKTSLEDAPTSNRLQFQLEGAAPNWATHFKYFVKDTASEYYNLAADRLYQSEDKLATWISFPSSERNKVTVDSYLIAKKVHDQNDPVVDLDNKFKIIDIQNEAPVEIAEVKEEVIESQIWFDTNFGDGNAQLTRNAGSTPIPNSRVFLIASDTDSAAKGTTSILRDELVTGAFIRFSEGDSSYSKYYKIASVLNSSDTTRFTGLGETSNVHTKVYVTEPFGEDVNFIYTTPGDQSSPLRNSQVTLSVSTQQPLANQEQFTGRFFIKLASNTVLNNVFSSSTDFITLNAVNCYYGTGSSGGYINGDVNFKIHAGGKYPRAGYAVSNTSGGLNIDENPRWANDDTNDIPYDILFEKRHRNPLDNDLIAAINTVGTKIRFSNHSTVYTIKSTRAQPISHRKESYTRYWTQFDKLLTASVSPHVTGVAVTVEIVGLQENKAFTSNNPAIFETEPAEGVDLDLYYEASDAYPISEYNDIKTLDYFNCFAFGNGVESNRVRDDFNSVTIDKGPKVSAVLDEPYAEEHKTNGIIWSGILNSSSGVNNLNQFLIAETITKDISPIYGPLNLLHARDTDIIIGCEDKILQALADKDALYNADGSSNITASNAVIGDVRPFVGEYGIDAESFASYGFRIYGTDKKKGKVIRLSRDGITPIVSGYESELEKVLNANSDLFGSYDADTDSYNLAIDGKTHQFNEESRGWTGTWEINPDAALTLNNIYYTSLGGRLWAHDEETVRNSWFGTASATSSITLIFNDQPSSVKKFKTLSYEGDTGWIATEVETDLQSGRVLTWETREGKHYNYIKGLPTTWNNTSQIGTLDAKEFSVQGIGNLVSISGDTTKTTYIVNVYDDPSDHEYSTFGDTFDDTFN